MQTTQNGPRLLLSIGEAAAALGVSERWVELVLGRGELASVRLGRRRLIRPEDLEEFINARVERQGVAVP